MVEDIVDTGLTIAHLLELLRHAPPGAASRSARCSTSRPAPRSRCPSTTSASPSRIGSSSATASTGPSTTATCRTSASWSEPSDSKRLAFLEKMTGERHGRFVRLVRARARVRRARAASTTRSPPSTKLRESDADYVPMYLMCGTHARSKADAPRRSARVARPRASPRRAPRATRTRSARAPRGAAP